MLRERVPMRIALHRHPGVHGVVEAAEDILRAVPGVELVDLSQPAVGLHEQLFPRAAGLPARTAAATSSRPRASAGVDALVAVYHADHRELCAHERDWPFRIMNMLEIVGASMGAAPRRPLQAAQDDAGRRRDRRPIARDLVAQHGLDPATTRLAIQAMLDEQPLPLRGSLRIMIPSRAGIQ